MVKKSSKKKSQSKKSLNEKEESESVKSEDKKSGATKKVLEREDKQLIWFIIGICAVFGIFLGAYFYTASLNNFEYLGLEWEKIKFGELDLYHTKVPIIYRGELVVNYNIYLRSDPRENDVPVNVNIGFTPGGDVIRTAEYEQWMCSGAKKGFADLGDFLSYFPTIENVTGGFNDAQIANETSQPYYTCENATGGDTVIMWQKSDNPSIVQDSEYPSCYILNVGECESIKTTEAFIIEFIRQLGFEKVEIKE